MASFRFRSSPVAAAAILVLAVGAAAQFPCDEVADCTDDPDFLLFGIFPCSSVAPDPCTFPDGAAACALTCLTCQICQDPEPVTGFNAIVQYKLVGETLIIYMDSDTVVSGLQARLGCTVDGESRNAHGLGAGCLISQLHSCESVDAPPHSQPCAPFLSPRSALERMLLATPMGLLWWQEKRLFSKSLAEDSELRTQRATFLFLRVSRANS